MSRLHYLVSRPGLPVLLCSLKSFLGTLPSILSFYSLVWMMLWIILKHQMLMRASLRGRCLRRVWIVEKQFTNWIAWERFRLMTLKSKVSPRKKFDLLIFFYRFVLDNSLDFLPLSDGGYVSLHPVHHFKLTLAQNDRSESSNRTSRKRPCRSHSNYDWW